MIDVIIPSYNQEEYLPDCIDSVLAQTIKPNTVIIVDDGSTDNSLGIARGFDAGDGEFEVIEQVNKGLSSARNTGIMNSTSEYCFFLDADDMITEDCLEKIMKKITATDADIIAPSLKEIGMGQATVIINQEIKLEDFKKGNYLPCACAVKRSKLLEVGGYSPRMTFGWEDKHLWINLLSRGATVATIQEPLFLYRIKEKSMIHIADEHSEELTAQIKKDFPKLYDN